MTIVRLTVAVFLSLLLVGVFMPVLNLGYLGIWVCLFIVAGLCFVPSGEETVFGRAMIWLGCTLLFAVIATSLTWAAFHSEAYRNQLGAETTGNFNTVLPPIDIHESPLVSEDMAHRSAEKQLADVPALGSQFELGHFQKQLINGRLYWVSFLQYRSFLTWFNTKATPGYVRVSAVDAIDVKLVTHIDNKPLTMRYLPSSYFGDSLRRHLYLHGFAGRGIAAISPEVDETGKPFYVVTFYKNTVGFSGAESESVAIVDPQTGDIQKYSMKNAPEWADILEAPDMIEEQVSNRGWLVHGWMNSANKDRLQVSGEPDLVYGTDKRAYWYIGMTSSGNDSGLVGFYLIDSRNKSVHRFTLAGATEDVAAKAAEGVIPEKSYKATNPLPFVVAGRPTYVFSLRDDSGIARAFAMVSIQTFQTLAVGESLTSTLRQYEAALSRDPTSNASMVSTIKPTTLKGKIARIAAVVHQGNTYYTLLMDNLPGRLLVASSDLSDALPLAVVGDEVQVSFEQNPSVYVYNLTSFNDEIVLPTKK